MNNYKEFGVRIALEAGEIIKKNFSLGMQKQWKSDNSPVTETDKAINSLLIARVRESFQEHNVLAEEESSILEEGNEFVWVCDPVDGIIPFSHGVPICTFSLALVKKGEPIFAVVFDPFGKRLFVAEKGKGAFLNDKLISVSKNSEFRGSVGSYEMFEKAKYNINKLLNHLQQEEGVNTIKLSSFIYTACLVAAGEFVYAIFPNITAHDAASVKLIVEEAGGKVTDLFGNEQRYDQNIEGLIASNGIFHEKLVELSKEMTSLNSVSDKYISEG